MAIQENGNYTPERIVSPGVFTREISQGYLAQGVASIGGVVVAPFKKGPGFYPTVVTSEGDLTSIFGTPDGTLYGPTTAQQYIRQQGQVTVCRVGGLGGYQQSASLVISAIPGQYGRVVESGSFSGSIIGATYTNVASGAFDVSGSLALTFESGVYSGSTVVVGTVAFTTNPDSTITTDTGSVFVSSTTASLALATTTLAGAAWMTDVNIVLTTVNSCLDQLDISGTLTGSYGALDYTDWTAGIALSEDGCFTASLTSGSDSVVLAVLANTALDSGQNLYGFSGSVLTPVDTASVGADFDLTLADAAHSTTYGTYRFSLDDESSDYLTSVFGTDPDAGLVPVATGQKVEAAYTYVNFKNRTRQVVDEMLASGSWKITISTRNDAMLFTDGVTPDVGDSAYDLTNASTPFIRSQDIGGNHYDLFKVHTLVDGTDTNKLYKLEITNVKAAGSISGTDFGSFSLVIRDYNDTDTKPVVLERFDNLNLDEGSANYVARRIGDQYGYIDHNGKILTFGDYKNISKTVRIEMATSVWPTTAIPYGFGLYASPIGGEYARLDKLPPVQYCSASIYASNPGRYASGVVFNPAPSSADSTLAALYPNGSSAGPERDNKEYFAPTPQYASVQENLALTPSATGSSAAFDLESVCGVTPLYVPSAEATNVKKRRFVLGFQGGFDGQSPSVPLLVGNDILPTNQQGLDCSTSTSYGSYGYTQCLSALGNADEWDFNLITTPGINYQYHPSVVTATVEVCENRGDAFYILDIAPNQTAGAAAIENVVDLASQFDTNYAGTYYPWVRMIDANSNKIVSVPPSVVMMGVYAANDKVSAEWFAPAGLLRGGIPSAVGVVDRLTHVERDTLYEGRVNPIAAFPGQGVVAWGQKTLQLSSSPLDRINVRRLLIAIKKFIASSSRFLTFEQNVAATRQRFLNIVNPYLESVQQRSGIYSFRVVMDDTNNSPDLIDQNILYGQLYIQPTRTAEFILLDFNVMPAGATFPTG